MFIWKSGGFVQGLPVEVLRLLERPLHALSHMELLLTCCVVRFISLQVLVKGVKTGLILSPLPGILKPY